MKKTLLSIAALVATVLPTVAQEAPATVEHKIYDAVTFYDGYLVDNFDKLNIEPDGILRHTTSCYAVKLSDEVLSQIGTTVSLKLAVQACCDNYDRIGNVNLALVPKGSETYNENEVQRIELGRFITPFMDKNVEPSTVPYEYSVDYLSRILRDAELRSKYDLWLEYEIFGVPYAANEQIEGCAGRSDVFKGTLSIVTSTDFQGLDNTDVLVPIVMKKPEYKGNNLNNYNELATDTIGKTSKTYTFTVPKDVTDGSIVLVTSNHGSNSGGEEYKRRWHYVYFDDQLVLTYKPGRRTCEPFRKYNTQVNGIYGVSIKLPYQWQSFSNWCPGDVIDNRIIPLGALNAGEHKVKIMVPDAKFNESQGDIPVSMFFQGVTQGVITGIQQVGAQETTMVPFSVSKGIVSFGDKDYVSSVEVYDITGKCLYRSATAADVDLNKYPAGVYLLNVENADGIIETHKIANK